MGGKLTVIVCSSTTIQCNTYLLPDDKNFQGMRHVVCGVSVKHWDSKNLIWLLDRLVLSIGSL